MFQNSKNEFLCFLQWLALRVLLGNAGVSTVHTWLEKREREKLHRVMHVNFSWQKRSNCVIERIMYVIGFEPMGEPHG